MFGSKSKSTVISSDNTTLIASGTEISGEIAFSGCLEIEGVVRGNIVAEPGCEVSQVRIQNSGQVHGDVCSPVVIVNSGVEGNVYSSTRVELAANAVVHGDVHYQIIEMVKGAQINGGLLYAPNAAAASTDSKSQAIDSDEVVAQYVDAGLND